MPDPSSLWTTGDRSRWFIVLNDFTPPAGPTLIRRLSGELALVDPNCLAPFEVTEDQARRWAKDQLGRTLDELKHGIEDRLADLRQQLAEENRTPVTDDTTVTPDVVPALFDLLTQLPRVIGNSLSGDATRVDSAKAAMAALQRRLQEAGVDLDDRLTNYPDRLAGLRTPRSSKPE